MRWRSHAGQNCLDSSCGAVNIEAHLNETFDDPLDVFLGCCLLHSYYHGCFPVSPVVPGAFLRCDASSSFCSERITSMMRSYMWVSSISGSGPGLAARTFSKITRSRFGSYTGSEVERFNLPISCAACARALISATI